MFTERHDVLGMTLEADVKCCFYRGSWRRFQNVLLLFFRSITIFLQILGSLYLLRGRILEALDNRVLAAEAFKEALRMDAFCMEAFKALVSHEILSADEEKELLSTMPVADQSDSSGWLLSI
jgi:hypothetical protein